MFGFLWKKRKVNRTQSAVLGDYDETLMCLPSDTAAWVVAKFNEMTSAINAKDAEAGILRSRVLKLSHAIDEITEAVRPYVADLAIAKRVFTIATDAAKV